MWRDCSIAAEIVGSDQVTSVSLRKGSRKKSCGLAGAQITSVKFYSAFMHTNCRDGVGARTDSTATTFLNISRGRGSWSSREKRREFPRCPLSAGCQWRACRYARRDWQLMSAKARASPSGMDRRSAPSTARLGLEQRNGTQCQKLPGALLRRAQSRLLSSQMRARPLQARTEGSGLMQPRQRMSWQGYDNPDRELACSIIPRRSNGAI